ncbi:L-serine dehydratase [Oceanospirillum multiglobuliferum]|uniref:L-serine dehydratase n=1 Tax=Oceanospirillum multiglobuliferum TaxID=64969 RepID=A0A1T4KX54_9GAMM|nr:L-serine ammonia-lyase [Oceanospirillum multiglobuliferum]OPX54987.1 L-serine ammonia-lyase [Oceanospirillum multiglobuliferum]SJZ46897.1 L-serine dehydratase [Oceanospirillum multiglobuliferum]
MSLSIFDLFKIGIGPSSSHTVGPMLAASRFIEQLENRALLSQISRVKTELFGSLALTGVGHATDTAVLLGLSGEVPDQIKPETVKPLVQTIRQEHRLKLAGEIEIQFNEDKDLVFNYAESLPEHPNGMRFSAFDSAGIVCFDAVYYSVGGGFVLSEQEMKTAPELDSASSLNIQKEVRPYPFNSGKALLEQGQKSGQQIADMMLANELALWQQADQSTSEEQIKAQIKEKLLHIWQVMDNCVRAGCSKTGVLPGGLKIKRRAPALHKELTEKPENALKDQLTVMDWVNLFAMAVNEENAAGGRVVTAPTNGAAGVIPAVLTYYVRFLNSSEEGIVRFLATASAIGMLYKENASISAAEVGCQGEIGVACSMAAGALCAVMGGTNEQIENAAEIGMEHNLGLTCDPIGGLVQVPCIERNTMGAVKAINAARLAIRGDGQHHVSLDSVIETMRQTGLDMQDKYKETSMGGLAVNVVNC